MGGIAQEEILVSQILVRNGVMMDLLLFQKNVKTAI